VLREREREREVSDVGVRWRGRKREMPKDVKGM